jgi:hypothetical protein
MFRFCYINKIQREKINLTQTDKNAKIIRWNAMFSVQTLLLHFMHMNFQELQVYYS